MHSGAPAIASELKAALLAARRRRAAASPGPLFTGDQGAAVAHSVPGLGTSLVAERRRSGEAWRAHGSIFISYAHVDVAVVRRLSAALTRLGFGVWWDRELRAGEDFSLEIEAALAAAAAVIVVWSEAAVRSRFVRDEAERGIAAAKLISTRLEGFDPTRLPIGFGQLQTIAVTDLGRIRAALDRFDTHLPRQGRATTALPRGGRRIVTVAAE
jgi:hypothetical protein